MVIAGPLSVDHFLLAAVIKEEIDAVVGDFAVLFSVSTGVRSPEGEVQILLLGVRHVVGQHDIDVISEFRVLRNSRAFNLLDQVQGAAADVGGEQRGAVLIGGVVLGRIAVLDPVIRSTVHFHIVLIAGGDVGRNVCFIQEDEHGQRAVDIHGVHDVGLEFPVIGEVARFLQLEVMSFGEHVDRSLILIDGHQTDGDISGDLIAAILGQGNRVKELAVTVKLQDGRLLVFIRAFAVIKLLIPVFADPLLLNVDGLGSGLHSIRIRELYGLGVSSKSGVLIGQGRRGVGCQIAVLVEILPGLFRHDVLIRLAVFQGGDHVVGVLTRRADEGDRVGHTVQQRTHRGEIPVHGTVLELGLGGIVIIKSVRFFPLILEAVGAQFAVDRNGLGLAAGCPVDGDGAVPVIRQRVGDDRARIGIRHGKNVVR